MIELLTPEERLRSIRSIATMLGGAESRFEFRNVECRELIDWGRACSEGHGVELHVYAGTEYWAVRCASKKIAAEQCMTTMLIGLAREAEVCQRCLERVPRVQKLGMHLYCCEACGYEFKEMHREI